MRLLAFTDTHGALPAAEAIVSLAAREKPDAIVSAGDLAFCGGGYDAFMTRIASLERPVYFVPGNHEPPDEVRAMQTKFPYLRDLS